MASSNSTERNERCETCRFWQPYERAGPNERGSCQRYPPVYGDSESFFPASFGYAWCGEWKAVVTVVKPFILPTFAEWHRSLPGDLRRILNRGNVHGNRPIESWLELCDKTEEEILEIRWCGETRLKRLRSKMAELGLALKCD